MIGTCPEHRIFKKEVKKSMRFLFRSEQKKKAICFVDFDHWCISMLQKYGTKPDVRLWYNEICREYDLRGLFFFGDFSNPQLRSMLAELRGITNMIIETQNSDEHSEKDFTDFIMLDHIYRNANERGIDVFIIFSGDGHFSSVTSYLKNSCGKEVVVYGIKDSFSGQLKNCATKTVEMPCGEELKSCILRVVCRQLGRIYSSNKNANPTFLATASAVAAAVGSDTESVSEVMNQMIADGYLYQVRKYAGHGRNIKVIRLDTDRLTAAGLL